MLLSAASLTLLALSVMLFVGAASGTGIILSPPHRSRAGPQMAISCGQAVFDLLFAKPGASVIEIQAVLAPQFKATCPLGYCNAYQLTDNSENIQVWKLNDPIKLVVNASVPVTPNPGNVLDLYTYGIHMVDLDHSLGSNPIEVAFVSGVQELDAKNLAWWTQHITHWQQPKCASAGECALMWRVENYYTNENGTSGRTFADIQCIDFVIDWSS